MPHNFGVFECYFILLILCLAYQRRVLSLSVLFSSGEIIAKILLRYAIEFPVRLLRLLASYRRTNSGASICFIILDLTDCFSAEVNLNCGLGSKLYLQSRRNLSTGATDVCYSCYSTQAWSKSGSLHYSYPNRQIIKFWVYWVRISGPMLDRSTGFSTQLCPQIFGFRDTHRDLCNLRLRLVIRVTIEIGLDVVDKNFLI